MAGSVIDGVLYVDGTDAGEHITVRSTIGQDGATPELALTVGGEQTAFAAAGIRRIEVRAGGGDDTVQVAVPRPVPGSALAVERVRIQGGGGKDSLEAATPIGGTLLGGAGDDRLVGGAYRDTLRGGAGRDRLEGGDGPDDLRGGYGNDSIDGGQDSDRLFGGAGRDHFSPVDGDPEMLDRRRNERKDVPVANAGLITFEFTGTVTGADGWAGDGTVIWAVPGSTFRGTYTFNPAAQDTGADPKNGVYTTPNGAVHVEIGEFRWFTPASYVVVHDAQSAGPADIYEAGDWIPSLELTSHPELARDLDRWNFSLRVDGDDDLLNGPVLPLTPPDLMRAASKTLTLTGDNRLNLSPQPLVTITARLDSLTIVPTPA